MKRIKITHNIFLFLSLLLTYNAFGQWNSSGDHIYYNDGNVGIGKANPSQKLDVNGTIQSKYLHLRNILGGWRLTTNGGGKDLLFRSDPNNGSVETRMYLKQNGNVGIGTSNPATRLHIQGADNNGTTATLKITSGAQNMLIDGNEIDGSNGIYLNHNLNKNIIMATGGGKVGIGTAAPAHTLDVNGTIQTKYLHIKNILGGWQLTTNGGGKDLMFRADSNDGSPETRMYLKQNGNVGIGTSAPSSKLHVVAPNYARVTMTATTPANDVKMFVDARGTSGNERGQFGTLSNHDVRFYTNSQPRMIIKKNGIIGIGTNTPNSAYRLSVNGKIRAKEIVVETGWADFVFENDYPLMPLEEVEAYIHTHKHLPDIPSAKDVEENGVSVGEMESKLLQKVEELTLYLIDLKKENKALSQRLEQLGGTLLEN